jgi:hypothetical protein
LDAPPWLGGQFTARKSLITENHSTKYLTLRKTPKKKAIFPKLSFPCSSKAIINKQMDALETKKLLLTGSWTNKECEQLWNDIIRTEP